MPALTTRPAAQRESIRGDIVVGLLIFSGTVLYLAWLPRSLGQSDEAIYLYEAKRLLHGQVMYRDVFDLITPGWMYLMAGLFWLFGTTIDTARIAMAVLHGVAAVGVYGTCRTIGVRRGLSGLTAIAYLVVAQPAWPIASQHWLSTVLCVLLLWSCVARRARPLWALLPGVVLGLLIAVQQQRGLPMAAGVAGWLVLAHLVDRRYGTVGLGMLAGELAALGAGVLAVVVPLCVAMIVPAGADRVWRALVLFPLYNYGAVTHCPWGYLSFMSAWQGSFTFPRLLTGLPLVLIPSALRLAVLLVTGRGRREAGVLTLLLSFCAASALSIMYFPDFIHIAFIAPAFIVAAAENVDWAAGRVPVPARARPPLAAVSVAVLLAAAGVRLHRNRVRLEAAFAFIHPTAFGRVAFATADQVRLVDTIGALVREAGTRELFAYPSVADLYLTVDVDNPTPFGFFVASFHSPDQVQLALDTLRAKALPYLVLVIPIDHDPVVEYIRQDYEPLRRDDPVDKLIYRRRGMS